MDQHLLVIRADASSIKGMIDGLRDRGYTVVTISNFEMAVDPSLAENFDLIIVEHSQNRIGALEICAELRQRNLPVGGHPGDDYPPLPAGLDRDGLWRRKRERPDPMQLFPSQWDDVLRWIRVLHRLTERHSGNPDYAVCARV